MPSPLDKIDLHIHTTFSDGLCSVAEAVKWARVKRLEFFAITDHYSEFCDVPKRMPNGLLRAYLDTLASHNVIRGVEADILPDRVSISKATASLFDLVLGGLHSLHGRGFWGDSHPVWSPKSFVEDVRVTLVKAIESGLLDVLVHPTWLPEDIRPQTKRLITKDWIESIVDTSVDHQVAIEISGAWKVPDELFIMQCLRQGVKLSIGSDAHFSSGIGDVGYAVNLLKRAKAPADAVFLPNRT